MKSKPTPRTWDWLSAAGSVPGLVQEPGPLTRTATVSFPSRLPGHRWEEPMTMANELRVGLQELLRKAELG